MPSINPSWPLTWTATSIAASTVTNGSTATTAAISQAAKTATEIAITIVYGGTATAGAIIYLLRDVDGTNYEAVADVPYGFTMPYSASTTYRRAFAVQGTDASRFKVMVSNPSGASITATVSYQQATTESV